MQHFHYKLIDNVGDYLYLKNGNFKSEVDPHEFKLRLHHFQKNKNQKLAGLWLAGDVVNHVGIYGSKVAEGFSAFQRRSCSRIKSRIHVLILMMFQLTPITSASFV